jgi:transposase-like protein
MGRRKPKSASKPSAAGNRTKRNASKPARRRRYTDAERQRILETAQREGLSGPKAAKRFGISTLTFYNWRKKEGTPRRSASDGLARRDSGDFAEQIRTAIRSRIREMLPSLIEEEVSSAVAGTMRRRR